jgi:hypothetical protein
LFKCLIRKVCSGGSGSNLYGLPLILKNYNFALINCLLKRKTPQQIAAGFVLVVGKMVKDF